MLKTVITLPDGTELSSGPGNINAIQKSTIIECVNSGEELTIGSTCANSFEATLFTPNGGFSISAGAEIKVAKEDENGNRWDVGVFVMEKPTRLTANTMKLVGYDRVSKLDKDLTAWLAGLEEWPYKLNDFASKVCTACGLTFNATEVPNMDYEIQQFAKSSVTGRQLMRWLGEICCSFCRANADGLIEFAWYTPADAVITPTGDSYYFQNGLTYEDYAVAPVEVVQIRLADSEDGALWPTVKGEPNSYAITGNPILTSNIDKELLQPVLDQILPRLAAVSYTPCKVNLPASMNIHAGNTVQITDKNGKTFTTYVMTKTQAGQKDTPESTGSARRDSSSAVNNKTQQEIAQDAVDSQTREDIFNKLTNYGKVQGIYQRDGKWYINAEIITSGVLRSADGDTYFDLDKGEMVAESDTGKVVVSAGGISLYDTAGKCRINMSGYVETAGDLTKTYHYDMKFFTAAGRCGLMIMADDDYVYLKTSEYANSTEAYRGWEPSWKEVQIGDEKLVVLCERQLR